MRPGSVGFISQHCSFIMIGCIIRSLTIPQNGWDLRSYSNGECSMPEEQALQWFVYFFKPLSTAQVWWETSFSILFTLSSSRKLTFDGIFWTHRSLMSESDTIALLYWRRFRYFLNIRNLYILKLQFKCSIISINWRGETTFVRRIHSGQTIWYECGFCSWIRSIKLF
jgi:hypothetical protein